MDEGRLAGLQVTELEEAVVRRAERHRHARRVVGRHAFRDPPGEGRRCDPTFGVGSVHADRDHPVPHGEAVDLGADLGHGAGALVSDDVGQAGEVSAQAIERVTALDADRLDVDQDVAGTSRGIGHVLVPEHLGRTRLVVHRCFHDRTYSRIRKRFALTAYHLGGLGQLHLRHRASDKGLESAGLAPQGGYGLARKRQEGVA